jgi:hypothetical protein
MSILVTVLAGILFFVMLFLILFYRNRWLNVEGIAKTLERELERLKDVLGEKDIEIVDELLDWSRFRHK